MTRHLARGIAIADTSDQHPIAADPPDRLSCGPAGAQLGRSEIRSDWLPFAAAGTREVARETPWAAYSSPEADPSLPAEVSLARTDGGPPIGWRLARWIGVEDSVPADPIFDCRVSHDGTVLYAVTVRGRLRAIDARTGRHLRTWDRIRYRPGLEGQEISVSPDHRFALIPQSGETQLVDLESEEIRWSRSGDRPCGVSIDGRTLQMNSGFLLYIGPDGSRRMLASLTEGEPGPGPISLVSPGCRHLATIRVRPQQGLQSSASEVRLLDPVLGTERFRIDTGPTPVTNTWRFRPGVAWSADEELVFVETYEPTEQPLPFAVLAFEAATGVERWSVRGPARPLFLTPMASRASLPILWRSLRSSAEARLSVHDPATGRTRRETGLAIPGIRHATGHAEGRVVWLLTDENELIAIDRERGERLTRPPISGRRTAIILAVDGSRAYLFDRRERVIAGYDLATGIPIGRATVPWKQTRLSLDDSGEILRAHDTNEPLETPDAVRYFGAADMAPIDAASVPAATRFRRTDGRSLDLQRDERAVWPAHRLALSARAGGRLVLAMQDGPIAVYEPTTRLPGAGEERGEVGRR